MHGCVAALDVMYSEGDVDSITFEKGLFADHLKVFSGTGTDFAFVGKTRLPIYRDRYD